MVASGLQDLISNATLPLFIKVRKVCRAEILPLEILGVPLLAILPNLVNLLCSMFSNAWISTVWADYNVLPFFNAAWLASKFRPRMISTTAKTSPSTCAAWCATGTYLSATALGTFLGIAAQGLLGLTRVCPCYRWCSSRSSASIKCLRQSHRFPCYVLDSQKVVLGLLSCLEHCLECLPLMSGIKRLDDAVLWKISAVVGLKTRIEAIPKMGAQAHWVVSLTR